MLKALADSGAAAFTVTYLEKSRYTGRYLAAGHGTTFRNFQVRRLLEAHYSYREPATNEIELVFDRHSHSASQLERFTRYLNENWNLPDFTTVTAVDSKYVEAIQVADVALRLFAAQTLAGDPAYADLDLDFIRAWDVSVMPRTWRP